MRFYLCLFFLFSQLPLFSQAQAQLSHPAPGELYRDDVLPRIDIILPSDSLTWLLNPANKDSDHHIQATFVFDNGSVRDTVEEVGFRIRGNFARNASKKSFKVSFNTYVPGRHYRGVRKLNLNGQHNDPTLSRAKLSADLARDLGIPAMRSNHVLLYLNGSFFGVYLNVEHIDKTFVRSRFGNQDGNLYKCLYPADLNYKGSDPALYKTESWGRRSYDLKNNQHLDDYSDLAHFIDVLNNMALADLPCELEKVFDADLYLRVMVFEILSGNWDGYMFNKNNYYLYHDQASGQFKYIPYDLDNTFGIDWIGQDWGNRDLYAWSNLLESRPLSIRLLQIPAYRDRFSFYMDEAIATYFNETVYHPYLDSLRTTLQAWVAQDSFYPLDFGFSTTDFQNGFDVSLPYQQTPYGIKSYIATRKSTALSQLILNDMAPVISEAKASHPPQDQPLIATVSVQDDQSLSSVEWCYALTDPTNSTCLTMWDDGQHQDGLAGDGVYGVAIPPLGQAAVVHYYIKAQDGNQQTSRLPACGFRQAYVAELAPKLAINEFLASNDAVLADPSGEYDDWVEIHNYGAIPIFLGDKYLSDKANDSTKWQLPHRVIEPGEFLLIWADDDDHQGDYHSHFKLKAGGEFIGIFNNAAAGFAQIDGRAFDAQTTDISFGRIPDGTGTWQAMSPTPGRSNQFVSNDHPALGGMEIQVDPNPFADALRLRVRNPDAQRLQIELVDMTGRRCLELSLSRREEEQWVQLADLPSGIYLFSVSARGQRVYVRKMVKR